MPHVLNIEKKFKDREQLSTFLFHWWATSIRIFMTNVLKNHIINQRLYAKCLTNKCEYEKL